MIQERRTLLVTVDRRLYIRPELKEYSPTERLLAKELDKTLVLAETKRTEQDIFTQLDQGPISLANPGLIQYSQKEERSCPNEGYLVPQAIQNILELLSYPDNEKVLSQWIENHLLVSNNKKVLDVLRATVRFTESMVDVKWFKQLNEIYPGIINIRSIKSLGESIDIAITNLQEGNHKNHLIDTYLILRCRFPNLLKYTSGYCSSDELPLLLEPNPDTIIANALTEIDASMKKSDITADQIAQRVLNYLIHSGLQDVDYAIRVIGKSSYRDVSAALYTLGANIHRVHDSTENTTNTVIGKNNQNLLENPRTDIVNRDLTTIIPEGATSVWVLDPTGTYGPCTLGHQSFVERITMYSAYIKKQHTQIHPLVLITPLVQLDRINHKNSAIAATETERAMNLMVHLAHLPNIHFTTQLQPDPAEAGSTAVMVRMMKESFSQQVQKDFARAGRSLIPEVEFVYCAGSDELKWDTNNKGSKRRLSEIQDPKFGGRCVIICRAGDSIDVVANGEEISKKFNADIILTPGSNTSSSSAIKQIAEGNYTALSLSALDQVDNWKPEAIDRRRQISKTGIITSIDEAYSQLLQLRGLIKD
jgi:hypothetical protein